MRKHTKHASAGDPGAPTVDVAGLTKKYGQHVILNRLDLRLPGASLVGLLGPNGAGKSTLIKLLCGLIVPDAGTIRLAGYDLAKQESAARGQLAYVPDVPNLYPELSVIEHLELVARAHGNTGNFEADSEMLLRRFGLWEARDSPTFALSRGMTQKVSICGAFIRPSKVLFMDEPGGSLDIGSLDELYKMLRDYRDFGGTALLSSHQWETLEDFCDTFVLLSPGKAMAGNLPFLREALGLEQKADLRQVYMAHVAGGGVNGHRIPAEADNLLAHMEP